MSAKRNLKKKSI